MKRKVLCVFSLLLILLTFCTFLSPKVQTQMQLLVEAKKVNGTRRGARNSSVGRIALTWGDSKDTLFEIVEGSGWESGLRVAEISKIAYDDAGDHVTLGPGTDYLYIYSASREPRLGESVAVLESTRKAEDTYLLVASAPMGDLSRLHVYSMTELQSSETAALVGVEKAVYPFFEHRTWYALKNDFGEDLRIYSMYDANQFLRALPWVTGVAMVLVCSLLLWAVSWIGKAERKKGILFGNIVLIGGMLGVLPWLLGQFDLPASMMPRDTILNIAHYLENFDNIFSALQGMGSDILTGAANQAATQSATVAVVSLMSVAVIATVELCLLTRKKA